MRKHRSLILSIICMILFCLFTPIVMNYTSAFISSFTLQDNDSENEGNYLNDNVEPTYDINAIGINENTSIYDNDIEDSVVYFYVTVSKGKAGSETDHTFSEVNNAIRFMDGAHKEDNIYAQALVQVGDENGPKIGMLGYNAIEANAKIRLRGNTSSNASQKSYALELNNNAGLWRGQSNIALNKHASDISRLNNKLYFDLLRDIDDVPSLRTQFVRLLIKDETSGQTKFQDYGLFTQVEVPNKRYLGNHGLDSNGYLYKAIDFNFELDEDLKNFSDNNFDLDKFEAILHAKGVQDNLKLITMVNALNNGNLSFEEVFTKYFDMDNYTTWLAFNILMGNIDTTVQNFYLYSPFNGDKWYFIPWDSDDSFLALKKRLFSSTKMNTDGYGIANYWNVILHQRFFKNEQYMEILNNRVDELYTYLTSGIIDQYIDMYDSVITPFIARTPDLLYLGATLSQRQNMISQYTAQIQKNYELYYDSLDDLMPFFIYDPITTNSGFELQWEDAYDFKNSDVVYTITISRDINFNNIVSEVMTSNTYYEFTDLPAGTYYYTAVANSNDGRSVQTVTNIVVNGDIYNNMGMVEVE